MKPETLNDIFSAIVERGLARVMMVREGTEWIPISAQELAQFVKGMAHALNQWGVVRGDRVAILSENRPEWSITDFACLQLGAVVVPIYSTLTAQQVAYILSHSGVKVVVASTQQQLEKVLSIKRQTSVEQIVVMDEVRSVDATHMRRLMLDASVQRDPALEEQAGAITPDALASIIYTSGTTGIPKGREADAWQLDLEHAAFAGWFCRRPGSNQSFFPAALACDRASCRFGITLSRRDLGLLSIHRESGPGASGGAPAHFGRGTQGVRKAL